MTVIKVGSRKSKLAVAQTDMVIDYINNNCDDKKAEIVTMKTTGDIILDKALDKIGGKGLFVKELDVALRNASTDLSVHSLKDMVMEVPEDLPIIGYSKREDARDVLVLPKKRNYIDSKDISNIDFTGPIGCSSKRRIVQLKKIFPNIEVKNVRGNVLTRLEKLDSGEYEALILAAAGLKRLRLEDRISAYFEPDQMIPAAGQGIICVQGRKELDYEYLSGFFDDDAKWCAICERAFVKELDGGCSSPIAAFSVIEGDNIFLRGLYYDEATGESIVGIKRGKKTEARELGVMLARQLKK